VADPLGAVVPDGTHPGYPAAFDLERLAAGADRDRGGTTGHGSVAEAAISSALL